MTKEQLSQAIQSLIESSGLSVTVATKVRDGEEVFGIMLKAGENPPQLETK